MTVTTRLEKPLLLRKIGKAIGYYHISKGWSHEELAFNRRLHRTDRGAVELSKRNITLLSLEKVAKTLGLSPKGLLAGLKKEGLDET